RPARRSPGGDGQRPCRAGARRVAASGGDPRGAAAAKAERRARRARLGARGGTGADRGGIRWDAPGADEIAFSTRAGGVSEGPFESLNLTHGAAWWDFRDAEANVAENRSRVCETIGADPARLTVNIQRHTSLVHRARPGRLEIGDALWTDEPKTPMLALGADCALIALVRANGARPAAAAVPSGRQG